MEQIKDKYLNPVPILYTYKGMPENTLISNDFDTAYNITLTKNDNEVSQLTFSIPFTVDRKVSYDDCEKLVLFENEYYIIKDIQVEDNATGNIKVTCKHESVELKGVYCEPINLIGVSPKDMFEKIMTSTKHPYNTGYKFKGTDVPSDKKRHLITENEASVYENLVSMAKVFNGWLEFSTDDNGQNWIFLRTKTIKNNKYVKKGLDMKALNISYNSDELFTRVQPFGAKKDGIEIDIMGVNPTKQSYVENYSWYLAKGIPMEVIKREAKYQQFKQMHMDEYTDAKDLYEFALEELKKCCVPKLEATLDMQDLSIYVDSLDEPPEIGYEITCINPDIDFILSCQITGVERNYDNPMATKVTIANFIRYDTVFQNINHGAEAGDRVTSGDSSDGTYVPEQNVNDGHINLTRKLGDFSTKIIENEKEIILVAEEADKNKAELVVQADKIESTVTRIGEAESHIEQNANAIKTKVSEKEMWSSIEQNASKITACIHGETDNMVQLDSNGLTVTNGGFRYENEYGDTLLESKAKGVRLGDSSWNKETSMKNIILGAVPLDNYFILSNIHINDDLNMGKADIKGEGTIKYNKIKADYLEVYNNAWVDGTLKCGSLECNDKHGVVDTENYGRILINAYETAEYYFGDIGESTIIQDNKIEINIDSKFSETVNLSVGYHVFTNVYNGSISKIERLNNSFVIHGENGTNFSWELKAKAKGKENYRLEPSRITAKGCL